MKKIFIDKAFLDLDSEISNGLITSLAQLQQAGFSLHVPIDDHIVPLELLRILNKENILLTPGLALEHDTVLRANQQEGIREQVAALLRPVRRASKERNTKETKISITINLDDTANTSIQTGIGFFDHMLEQIARHGNIGLQISVTGDLHVDEHHTVEDTGIAVGETLLMALGNKQGIKRYGFTLPMDDCIAEAAIDLGGRAFLQYKVRFSREKIGDFPTELGEEFFRALAQGLRANVYIKAKGKNEHHKMESMFKAFAKALNEACRIDERAEGALPSTKGVL